MASTIIPLVSLESSVFAPVYNKIANDVAMLLQVDPSSLRVVYNSMELSRTDVKINVKKGNGVNTPTTVSRKRFSVNVTDEFNNELLGSEVVTRKDNVPIFRDTGIGVSIIPIYTNSSILFEFKFITTSKIEVEEIRDRLRMFISRGLTTFSHDVEYTMILAKEVNDFLKDIWEMRNNLFPIEYDKYVASCSTNRLHYLTDMKDDSNRAYGVKTIIRGVVGDFDFTASPPDRVTNISKNQHAIAITYRVDMELPKSLYLDYPISFCNQMLPDKYLIPIDDFVSTNQRQRDTYPIYTNSSVTNLQNLPTSAIHRHQKESIYPINVPRYDLFKSANAPFGFSTLMTFLINVDMSDQTKLLNLNDLDDYYIPKEVLEYIKSNRQRVTRYNACLIFIGLEQGGVHRGSEFLTVDSQLNVRSKEKLHLETAIRVTINICTDLSYLKENIVSDIFSNDLLLKNYISEYIDLKMDSIKKNTNDRKLRDDSFMKYIIKKLYYLTDTKSYTLIRELLVIMSKDVLTMRNLGYNLHNSFRDLLKMLFENEVAFLESNGNLKVMSLNEKVKEHQILEHFNQSNRTHSGYSGRRFVNGRWIGGPSDNKTDGDNSITDRELPPNTWYPGVKEPNIKDDDRGDNTDGWDNGREGSNLFPRTMKTVTPLGIIVHRED